MATTESQRKKSPRAPSMALDEALDRTMKVYDKERLHATPTDVIAQHMGYKGANNGAALSALASIRYYGLVDRAGDGLLAVAKDVESYRHAPSEEVRRSFLKRFIMSPPIFAELLDKYSTGLPSDGNLKYELIHRGFAPPAAASLVAVLRQSVDFVGVQLEESDGVESSSDTSIALQDDASTPVNMRSATASRPVESRAEVKSVDDDGHDRIPVRLPGGRRAWLLIPNVFFESDKLRIKAQIDLLLTEEDNVDS